MWIRLRARELGYRWVLLAASVAGSINVSSAADGPIPSDLPTTSAAAPAVEVPAPPEPVAPQVPVDSAPASTPCVEDKCDKIGCDLLDCDAVLNGDKCDKNDCWLIGDEPLLKDFRDQTLWCDVKYSVGGELRYRYMNENNRLRPLGAANRDTYDLWRFTPYLEIGNDNVKGYVQAIDAQIVGNELPKLPIDQNRLDLLQYYGDVRLFEGCDGDLRARYGRMFLNYGDQHLISPLGWANTYRNFEGGKIYYSGEDWDIDGFVARPSNGAASPSVNRPESFDHADQSILFSGVYATYKGADIGKIDMFWLWNDESAPVATLHDGSRHTIGSRLHGKEEEKCGKTVVRTYTWDAQGGWQFGNDNFGGAGNRSVNAGFLSLLGGVTINEAPWEPTINGLFWWGSGDDDPTDGKITTVSTLYPLGHAYWGQIDNFNGANLLDYSVQLSVKPHDKWTLASHWHWFDKAAPNDHVYNIAGAPIGVTGTGQAHIGNELDLLATYQYSKNLQLQAGYFWFWYGDAINSQAALARSDAQQFYFMTTWGF